MAKFNFTALAEGTAAACESDDITLTPADEEAYQRLLRRAKNCNLFIVDIAVPSAESTLPEHLLRGMVSPAEQDNIASDKTTLAYKAKTIDKGWLSDLRRIRDKVQSSFEGYGVKSSKQNSTYFIPIEFLEAAHAVLEKASNDYSALVEEHFKHYNQVVNEIKASISLLPSSEVQRAALAKIPTESELRSRLGFSNMSFGMLGISRREYLTNSYTRRSLEKVLEERDSDWLSKITAPFGAALEKADPSEKMVGKKRGSIANCISKVQEQEKSIGKYFEDSPLKDLAEAGLSLLNEISVRFVEPKLNREQKAKLSDRIVAKYHEILSVMRDNNSLRAFVRSGQSLWDDGFDLRDPEAMIHLMESKETPVTPDAKDTAPKAESKAEEPAAAAEVEDTAPKAESKAEEPADAKDTAPKAESKAEEPADAKDTAHKAESKAEEPADAKDTAPKAESKAAATPTSKREEFDLDSLYNKF